MVRMPNRFATLKRKNEAWIFRLPSSRTDKLSARHLLNNPKQGDVTKAMGRLATAAKKASGGKPIWPYSVEIREAP
jgi:hypothetical protein